MYRIGTEIHVNVRELVVQIEDWIHIYVELFAHAFWTVIGPGLQHFTNLKSTDLGMDFKNVLGHLHVHFGL